MAGCIPDEDEGRRHTKRMDKAVEREKNKKNCQGRGGACAEGGTMGRNMAENSPCDIDFSQAPTIATDAHSLPAPSHA